MRVNSISSSYNRTYHSPNFTKNTSTPAGKNEKYLMKTIIPAALFVAMAPSVSGATKVNNTDVLPQNEHCIIYKTSDTPEYLQPEYIQNEESFKLGDKNYKMLYTDYGKKFTTRENTVTEIYIIPEGYKFLRNNYEELNRPPKIEQIIKHNTDDDEYFVGAVVSEMICDDKGGNFKFVTKEIVLPDNIGEALLKLHNGQTDLELLPDMYMEVDSPELQPTEVQDGKEMLVLPTSV